MTKNHKITEVEGEVFHETDKAYLFSTEDRAAAVWLPKSMCEWDESDDTMQLPEWLAEEKGLI